MKNNLLDPEAKMKEAMIGLESIIRHVAPDFQKWEGRTTDYLVEIRDALEGVSDEFCEAKKDYARMLAVQSKAIMEWVDKANAALKANREIHEGLADVGASISTIRMTASVLDSHIQLLKRKGPGHGKDD